MRNQTPRHKGLWGGVVAYIHPLLTSALDVIQWWAWRPALWGWV